MIKKISILLIIVATMISCNDKKSSDDTKVSDGTKNELTQTLYYGGDIITMDGDKPQYVEAVIERDGKIIYTGDKASAVNNFAGKDH